MTQIKTGHIIVETVVISGASSLGVSDDEDEDEDDGETAAEIDHEGKVSEAWCRIGAGQRGTDSCLLNRHGYA